MKIRANNIELEVEDSGGSGPAVLLVMGLGMQLIAWPEPFVQGLVQAGYRVLRHDNRDAGLSQSFDAAGTPSLGWQLLRQKFGLAMRAPYTLSEMAADALGLLDALGIAQAHVIGASMGGMIAQRMAIAAPARVRSLVSVMSTSGAPQLPGPRADVLAALFRKPPPAASEAALVEHSLGLVRLIASPGWPFDEAGARERIALALRRAYRPAGVLRQMLAIGADTGRAEALGRIQSPTLVLHGDADPLVPLACGQDSARRIPGARMQVVPGMAHDLPAGALPVLLSHILPFIGAVEQEGAA